MEVMFGVKSVGDLRFLLLILKKSRWFLCDVDNLCS
jgi:hypothetical protein